jgi:hypothetical protein
VDHTPYKAAIHNQTGSFQFLQTSIIYKVSWGTESHDSNNQEEDEEEESS